LNAAIGRWLLNTFPTGILVVLGIGGAVAVSVLGFALYKRLYLRSPNTEGDTMVGSFAERAETLLGVLLVFVIVSLYGSFQAARDAVQTEATGLAQFVRDTDAFPPAVGGPLRARVAAYVREVRGPEWHDMREGHTNARAVVLLDRIYDGLTEHSPRGSRQRIFYDDAVQHLDDVASARRTRLSHVAGSVPTALWMLVLVASVVGVVTMYPFSASFDRLQFWLIGISAVLIGAGLIVALLLDYPFAGSLAVSPEPLSQGTLADLLR
jgi:Protein of unknown function (DUF4239)